MAVSFPQSDLLIRFFFCQLCGVSALDFGSSGPGSLAGVIVLCSWARHFAFTVPLSTQVYKWVPANLLLGVTLRWTSIPSRGGSKNTPSRVPYSTKTGISSSLMGHKDGMQIWGDGVGWSLYLSYGSLYLSFSNSFNVHCRLWNQDLCRVPRKYQAYQERYTGYQELLFHF